MTQLELRNFGKTGQSDPFDVGGLPFHRHTNSHQHVQQQKHHLLQGPMQYSYTDCWKGAAIIKLVLLIELNYHKCNVYIYIFIHVLTKWSFYPASPLEIFFFFFPKRGTKISEFLEDIKQDQQTILSLHGVDCLKAFLLVG